MNNQISLIKPIPFDIKRPFWSVMIPTFNCARFLGETLNSVLAQDPGAGEMQIEVVDDCSTKDDPEQVVREIGKGRVGFYRNHINLGATRNFNNCLRRSTGKFIHILHGDDYVGEGFYSTIKSMINQEPDFGLFGTRAFIMDADGLLHLISEVFPIMEANRSNASLLININSINILHFPGIVMSRNKIEMTGGFDESYGHVADWEMWMRLIINHGGLLSNNPHAYYRLFDQNDSSRHRRSGNNILEIKNAFERIRKQIKNIDNQHFIKKLEQISYNQYLSFQNKKDFVAAAANYAVWKSTFSLKTRMKRKTAELIKAIFTIINLALK